MIAIAGTALFGAAVAEANGGNGNHGEGHTPVTLCHFVPAHGGSFITITVDDDGSSGNANLQGHAGHPNDIIPAPADGCSAPEATGTPAATGTPEATITDTPEATATATAAPATATQTATPTSTVAAATATNTATSGQVGGGVPNLTTPTQTATLTSETATSVPPSSEPGTSTAAAATGEVLGAATTPGARVGGVQSAEAAPATLPASGDGSSRTGNYGMAILGLALVGGGMLGFALTRRRA